MLIEAVRGPMKFHFADGHTVRLAPGQPVNLSDDRARRLLDKAPGKVRAIEPVMIEPAALNARPVYWETGTGRILGPAVPEFLARDGGSFWIVATFDGEIRWINADQLRSRKAFLEQSEVREVELSRSL